MQLAVPPGTKPVAGERTKLIVIAADAHGNRVPGSLVKMDVTVHAGRQGGASVERGGAVSIVDGIGEVWVRGERGTPPLPRFWISPRGDAALSDLAIGHTEFNPFELRVGPGPVTQFGLYHPRGPRPVPVGQPLVIGVRTEDAWGNAAAGFDGAVTVVSHSPAVHGAEKKVQLVDGDGRLSLMSDVAESFQLSLQDSTKSGLRVASVLVASFKSVGAVRAVFGDVPSAPQPAGHPFALPLLVLDHLGNVAEDYEGEIDLEIVSGDARIAGGAPPTFHVLHGRATLPVLATVSGVVRFALGDDSKIDPAAASSSPALAQLGNTTSVTFCAAEATRLVINVMNQADGRGAGALPGGSPPRSAGDGLSVRAGEAVHVRVRAYDAWDNLDSRQKSSFFLEAELSPAFDESLSGAQQLRAWPPANC